MEKAKEGNRGGIGEMGEGDEDLGRSGRVIEGAGLGEGMVRREESRDLGMGLGEVDEKNNKIK